MTISDFEILKFPETLEKSDRGVSFDSNEWQKKTPAHLN